MRPNLLRRRETAADETAVNPSDPPIESTAAIAYFTRDRHLFELAAEDWRLNAGLGPSVIREAALRDVVTEEVRFVTGASIAAYQPIVATAA